MPVEPTLSHIDFWDVGQGDCSVVHFSDGSIIIIDVGPKRSPLINWLHEKPKLIRDIILTHNDADHVGALASLLAEHGDRVGHVWMLLDRPKNNVQFEQIFSYALTWEKKTGREIQTALSGQSIWNSRKQGLELKIVHPSFSELMIANNPNKSSAMVILESKDGWLKAWAGDLELQTVVRKCATQTVHTLIGPHHGAPSDLRYKGQAKYSASIGAEALKLNNAFLSVGTGNGYKHPNPSYVFSLAKAGTHVSCSQLTKICDKKKSVAGKAIFNGSAMLGLPAASTGVACRGTKRISFNGDQILPDKYEMQHRLAIENLETPLCLKGSGWKKK